jgi:hypothetical protein
MLTVLIEHVVVAPQRAQLLRPEVLLNGNSLGRHSCPTPRYLHDSKALPAYLQSKI